MAHVALPFARSRLPRSPAFASRRVAGQLRALAGPLIAGPSDQLWAPAALDAAAFSNLLGAATREPASLAPWSLMATRGKKTGTKGLLDALSDEIEHEEENYKADEVLEAGPPNGFQLEDVQGKTHLRLKKKHRDNEEVEIDLRVNEQPPPAQAYDGQLDELETEKPPDMDDEDEDSNEMDYTVLFNVTVTKNKESLVFECESDGGDIDILKILLETKDKSDVMTDFLGPTYEELDDELKNSWQKYLEERGITSAMGDYLLELVLDKEQREYMDWLKRVKTFVAK